MDDSEKRRLRQALASGDVGAADDAMLKLIGVSDAQELDPDDLLASLDAMERLGTRGQGRMFESFLHFAERFPAVSVPVLVQRMKQFPVAWTSELCATVIYELLAYKPDGRRYIEQDATVEALVGMVAAAPHGQSSVADAAVSALHEWAKREPLPEAGLALAGLLVKAADEPSPDKDLIREARETLEASGQSDLLAPARDRARSLPADHPLRIALGF
jgi:hypothetical protein